VVREAKCLERMGLAESLQTHLLSTCFLLTGREVVANAFADRDFDVIATIDNDPASNATIKDDICNVDPSKLSGVADCVWASPDCSTYSALSQHRKLSTCEYARTDKAHYHDEVLAQTIRILTFTMSKNPHCIIIIENPANGSLNNDLPCE